MGKNRSNLGHNTGYFFQQFTFTCQTVKMRTLPINSTNQWLRYIFITGLGTLLSFLAHEFAHWTAGSFLGYTMAMDLNTTYPVNGYYELQWHYTVISASGPLFTLLQAVTFFYLLRKRNVPELYPLLFIPLYMRVLAGILSFFNLNDEGRISKTLGLGAFTLPVIVCMTLLLLVYSVSKRNNYSVRFNLITLLLVTIFSSAIILINQYHPLRII